MLTATRTITLLETNGTNYNLLKELIDEKLIDYVAMDIKTNFNKYKDIVKVNNPLIDNIKKSINLCDQNCVHQIRISLQDCSKTL